MLTASKKIILIFPNQLFRSTINPTAVANKAKIPLPPVLSPSAALEVVGSDADEVAVPLAEVDVLDEASEVLEDSIVVVWMDVGTDTDVGTNTDVGTDMDVGEGEVPPSVEVLARAEVKRVRDGF